MAYLEVGNTANSYTYNAGDNYEGIRFYTDSEESLTALSFSKIGNTLLIQGRINEEYFTFSIENYPFTADTTDDLNNLYFGTSNESAVSLNKTISNNYRIEYTTNSNVNKSNIGSLYSWNIVPTANIDVTGLDSGDNITVAASDYALSRNYNGTDNNTLKITTDTKVINVTNFNFNSAVSNTFKFNNNALATNLTVTTNQNYTATDIYAENIVAEEATSTIQFFNLKANDTLTVPNAKTYYRRNWNELELRNSTGTTTIAVIKDFNTNHAFTFNDGTENVDFSQETLNVILKDFDAETSNWGFGSYHIYGGSGSHGTLKGGSGNDTIELGPNGAEVYGNQGNDTIIGGSSFGYNETFYFKPGDGTDTIIEAGSYSTILINAEDITIEDLTFTKDTVNNTLTISGYGGENDKVIVNYNYSDPRFNIYSLNINNETYNINDYVLYDIVLDNENPTFNKASSVYKHHKVNVSLDAGLNSGSVSGLKAGDNLNFALGYKLSRTYDTNADTNATLVITNGDKTFNVTNYDFSCSPEFKIAGGLVAQNAELRVTASADYTCSSAFSEVVLVNGEFTITGNDNLDKILFATGTTTKYSQTDANTYTIENASDATKKVTLSNFAEAQIGTFDEYASDVLLEKTLYVSGVADFDGTQETRFKNFNIIGNGTIKGSDLVDTITAGLDGANIYGNGGDDIIEGNDNTDSIHVKAGDGTDTLTNITSDDKIYVDILNASVTAVKSNSTLRIHYGTEETDNIDITDFAYNDLSMNLDIYVKNGEKSYAAPVSIYDILTVSVEPEISYNASSIAYRQNITVNGEVTITGLAEKDNLILADGKLSRVWDGANNNTLTISKDTKIANITDFFSDSLPEFTLNGIGLPDKLTVTLDDTENAYNCTEFHETITGNGIVSGATANTIVYMGDNCEHNAICEDGNITFTYHYNGDLTANHITINGFIDNNGEFAFPGQCLLDGDNNNYEHLAYNDINITVSGMTKFKNVFTYIQSNHSLFNTVNITGTINDDLYVGGSGDDTISGGDGNDILDGKGGDDSIIGGLGNDTIYTGSGDDTIDCGAGDDFICVDGYGEKTITGGTGNDTYYFSKGTAVLTDAHAGDKIQFATFDPSLIAFTKEEKDLVIKSLVQGDNDTITVKNYFNTDGTIADNAIKTFVLNGGKEITLSLQWLKSNIDNEYYMYNVIKGTNESDTIEAVAGIKNWIEGKNGDDTIIGADQFDILAGESGNDKIIATSPAGIYGGPGKDEIKAIGGNSFIVGGSDDDYISVSDGENTICLINKNEGAVSTQTQFGNDTIQGASSTDILKFSLDYGEGAGANRFVGYKYDDLKVERKDSNLIIKAGDDDNNSVIIENYFIQEEKNRVDKIQAFTTTGNSEAMFSLSDLVERDIFANKKQTEKDVIVQQSKNNINGDANDNYVNMNNFITPNGKGVIIDTKSGNDVVIGSIYNDTVKSSSKDGESANITEYGGVNKITTGEGDDVVYAYDYSSNDINVGAGDNTIYLNSAGKNTVTAKHGSNDILLIKGMNKVTLGNGNNTIYTGDGTNSIKAGKGENKLIITGGINTITTGNGKDEYIITEGNNSINSGIGEDIYNIVSGNNVIKTGNAETKFNISNIYNLKDDEGDIISTFGGDGGINSITSGSKSDTFDITAGKNDIKSGAGNDIFNLSGGNNIINAAAGNDIFTVSAGYNYLNGAAGNDTYKVDLTAANGFDFANGSINILDTSGKNTLDIKTDAADSINLFFDVDLKKNKKGNVISSKGNNAYTYSALTFTTENIDSDVNGISVINNKSITTVKINDNDYTLAIKDINTLAQNVANWLTADGREFDSTSEAFKTQGADVTGLIKLYTDFSNQYFKE